MCRVRLLWRFAQVFAEKTVIFLEADGCSAKRTLSAHWGQSQDVSLKQRIHGVQNQLKALDVSLAIWIIFNQISQDAVVAHWLAALAAAKSKTLLFVFETNRTVDRNIKKLHILWQIAHMCDRSITSVIGVQICKLQNRTSQVSGAVTLKMATVYRQLRRGGLDVHKRCRHPLSGDVGWAQGTLFGWINLAFRDYCSLKAGWHILDSVRWSRIVMYPAKLCHWSWFLFAPVALERSGKTTDIDLPMNMAQAELCRGSRQTIATTYQFFCLGDADSWLVRRLFRHDGSPWQQCTTCLVPTLWHVNVSCDSFQRMLLGREMFVSTKETEVRNAFY